MQSASFRVWTRVAESISYVNNHYTSGTSKGIYVCQNQRIKVRTVNWTNKVPTFISISLLDLQGVNEWKMRNEIFAFDCQIQIVNLLQLRKDEVKYKKNQFYSPYPRNEIDMQQVYEACQFFLNPEETFIGFK